MSRVFGIFLVASMFGCGAASAPAPELGPSERHLGDDLVLRELEPGLLLHVSAYTFPDGPTYTSNGLLLRESDGWVMIDTAWGDEPTARLIEFAREELGAPIVRAIATHWHADRAGGAGALAANGIPLLITERTRSEGVAHGLDLPAAAWDLATPGSFVKVGDCEVFYPGPAHSPDNIVVWIERYGVLSGGCAVRSADSVVLGNLSDADVPSWPASIERVMERYGTARIVVPGHGDLGDASLLSVTHRLARAGK